MKKGIVSIVVMIVVICIAPYVLTQCHSGIVFGDASNDIGGTIGGTTAPIIGIGSIVLLYLTLYEQIKFNKRQRIQVFDEQFKSNLFSLLQTQRDIQEKTSGVFHFLGNDLYVEKRKSVNGLNYFKVARKRLAGIYDALDSEKFYGDYDLDSANSFEVSLEDDVLNSVFPTDENRNKYIKEEKRPWRISYINHLYTIKENIYNLYRKLPIDEKIGMGFALFRFKHEEINNYLIHLCHILKFIRENEQLYMSFHYDKKASNQDVYQHFKQFADFVQAQMSQDELLVLFYYSFMNKELQKLIIYYNLLEHLSIQDLIKREHNCNSKIKLKDKISSLLSTKKWTRLKIK